MAKIVYSALVSRIRGSLGGTTFANWKGIEVMKTKVLRPRQPHSTEQQLLRTAVSWLSGRWYALTAETKAMWNQYGSLLPKRMSGFNSFMALNVPGLFYNQLGGYPTAVEEQPPQSVSTPGFIEGLSLVEAAGVTTVTWTSPILTSESLIAEISYQSGLDDSSHPRWSYIGQAGCNLLTLAITHGFPVGAKLRYRFKVMDTQYRQSPYSATQYITATVPA